MKIEEKTIEEEQIAVIKHIGPVEEMGSLIEKIEIWAAAEDIELNGPPFAIYYNYPQKENADKTVYDIGFPVEGDVKGNQNISIATIPEHKVVYAIYIGPYSEIQKTYQKMVNFVMTNHYDVIGSPKEIYHNSPQEVAAGELMTEIQFPVIHMG
ncbi:GyrI-like domain-containing protein [Methanobacterium alcaliphilum]|uniref:GyrI-like domain-containing protein n=1 Tax=Methanobacterium alcaliphilum TaxID=392018 RepID=UPI00200ACAC2|nr:GyrI-like domain-containing protein [Methanobacterium alcaliphilum]MCK9150460.1 GyrI-like domain-containing protein [Methanobacterium alcaliphilum]